MSEVYDSLVQKAEKIAKSDQYARKKIDMFLSNELSLPFKSFFLCLDYKDSKELIILYLHHLCRLFATEEVEIEYTEKLAEWLQWAKATYPEDIAGDVFSELDMFFRGGFMKNVQQCENISQFKRIYNIAQMMIKSNADPDAYYNIIKFKLTPLIWRSIRKVIEGNSDKQGMLEILYGINVAQHYQIPIETTAIHFISVVQNQIISKNDVYGISEYAMERDDQEAKELLTSIKMIQVEDENLKKQRDFLISIFGVNDYQELNEPQVPNSEIFFNLNEEELKFISPINLKTTAKFIVSVDFYNYNSSKIAIKTYKRVEYFPLEVDKIMTEINVNVILSKKANKENCFLNYYGTKVFEDKVQLFMEYHPKTLENQISLLANENPKVGFNPESLMVLVRKLFYSFSHMEELNIYHRDIKPSNLLYTDDGDLKIIDFSVSEMKVADDNSSSVTNSISVSGTPAFMAPEVYEAYANHQKVVKGWSEKADIFSLGMTILQMITLSRLDSLNFREYNNKLIDLVDTEVRNLTMRSLLKKMLSLDPRTRPTFAECLRYFNAEDTID